MSEDLSKIFTSIVNIQIPGENGIYTFYFQSQKQYRFTEIEWRYRKINEEADGSMDMDGHENLYCYHYKVVDSSGDDYCWFPVIYGPIEYRLRTLKEKDYWQWVEDYGVDQPKDWKAVYKQLTGKDIDKCKRISYNGHALGEYADKHRLDNNGKVYRRVIPRED